MRPPARSVDLKRGDSPVWYVVDKRSSAHVVDRMFSLELKAIKPYYPVYSFYSIPDREEITRPFGQHNARLLLM